MADDTTLYVFDSDITSVLGMLEHKFELAIAWFDMNYKKLNADKFHLL